jgi:hypothetical protein
MKPLVALVVAELVALAIRTRILAAALIPGASPNATILSVILNFVFHTNNAEVLLIG